MDRVAFVPDKLAAGLERGAGLAPPAPVGAAELGDRLPGREPAPGPLQQFVALLHAGVEPIGELRGLALRADQRAMVVQHLRERRGHSPAGFLRVVLDPPDELGITGGMKGMGPLPSRVGGMRLPVAKQCFRGIGNAEFPVDRGGVARDLLAEARPGQPVVAAHPRIGHDLFRLARRAVRALPPVLRVRVRVAGKTRELVPAFGRRIDARLTLAALATAIKLRDPPAGCIHHSDSGSQYAAQAYRALLSEHGLVGSMGRRGNPYDNAMTESFMKTLKVEGVYPMRDRRPQIGGTVGSRVVKSLRTTQLGRCERPCLLSMALKVIEASVRG